MQLKEFESNESRPAVAALPLHASPFNRNHPASSFQLERAGARDQ
jgi:hypothetical protein